MPTRRTAVAVLILFTLPGCDGRSDPDSTPTRSAGEPNTHRAIADSAEAARALRDALERLPLEDADRIPEWLSILRREIAAGRSVAPEVAPLLAADDGEFAWLREVAAKTRPTSAGPAAADTVPGLAAALARMRGSGPALQVDLARAVTPLTAAVDARLTEWRPQWLQSLNSKAALPAEVPTVQILLERVPDADAERLFGPPTVWIESAPNRVLRVIPAALPEPKADLLWNRAGEPGVVSLTPCDLADVLGKDRATGAAALRSLAEGELAIASARLAGRSCSAAIDSGYRLTSRASGKTGDATGTLHCAAATGEVIELTWRVVAVGWRDGSVGLGLWIEPPAAAAGHRTLTGILAGLSRLQADPAVQISRGPGSLRLVFE